MSKAIELFQRAVDLNCLSAMNNLAFCYKKGIGVEKDILKAIDLYYKSGKKVKGDELCNIFDITHMFYKKQQINNNLIEEYMLLISKCTSDIVDNKHSDKALKRIYNEAYVGEDKTEFKN